MYYIHLIIYSSSNFKQIKKINSNNNNGNNIIKSRKGWLLLT